MLDNEDNIQDDHDRHKHNDYNFHDQSRVGKYKWQRNQPKYPLKPLNTRKRPGRISRRLNTNLLWSRLLERRLSYVKKQGNHCQTQIKIR